MDPALVGAIVGAIVAGVLTPIGSIVVASYSRRQVIRDKHQEAHIAAAAEAVSALQQLNRELINIARDSSPNKKDADNKFWEGFHNAQTRWNTARHVAALYCTQAEIDCLTSLDDEVDKLARLARGQTWNSRHLRPYRVNLGMQGAEFIKMARAGSGQPPIELASLWTWSDDVVMPPQPLS